MHSKWIDVLVTVWIVVCLCGALIHGGVMDDRRRMSASYTPVRVARQAWFIANVIHLVVWTMLAFSVVLVVHYI
jgi:hypothetical protein